MPGKSPSHGTLFSVLVSLRKMRPPSATVSPSWATRVVWS